MGYGRLRAAVDAKNEVSKMLLMTSTTRRVYKYKNLRFWAENGLCKLIDENNDAYHVYSCERFAAEQLKFLITRARGCHNMDEKLRCCRAAEDMRRCILTARKQGDPHDPRHIATAPKVQLSNATINTKSGPAILRV